MKLIWAAFRLDAKRSFMSATSVLLLAVVIAVMCAGGYLLKAGPSASEISVAIVMDNTDMYAHGIVDELPEISGVEYTVLPLNEWEDVTRRVSTGEIECAYYLHPQLKEALLQGGSTGITLAKSPRTVMDSLINDRLFSAVLNHSAPDIVVENLISTINLSEDSLRELVGPKYTEFRTQGEFVGIEAIWSDGHTKEKPQENSAARPLHGLCAIMLIIASAAGLPRHIKEKDRILSALQSRSIVSYYLGVYICMLIRMLLLGILALLLARGWHPEALYVPKQELVLLLAYCVSITSVGLLLIALLHNEGAIFAGTIFTVIATILLGGVFFDAAELGGLMERISILFFTNSYINGVLTGLAGPQTVLWAIGLAGSLLGLLIFHRQRQRGSI